MFKIIIVSQIGANRYQNLIFKVLLLSLGELCGGVKGKEMEEVPPKLSPHRNIKVQTWVCRYLTFCFHYFAGFFSFFSTVTEVWSNVHIFHIMVGMANLDAK